MRWTPLCLMTPLRHHVFGGRNIAERLGRRGLPDWTVAETWEVSDVEGAGATVREGPFAGRSLRELTLKPPDELVGRGCCAGAYFALERWRLSGAWTYQFDGARILSNVGGPVALRADDWRGTLPPGETLLLPAALGSLEVQGPASAKQESWEVVERTTPVTRRAGVGLGSFAPSGG